MIPHRMVRAWFVLVVLAAGACGHDASTGRDPDAEVSATDAGRGSDAFALDAEALALDATFTNDAGRGRREDAGGCRGRSCESDPLAGVTIELGAEETVFDWTNDRCADMDLPDVVAHPMRIGAELVLASGNAPDNYFMRGSDFGSLRRDCDAVLRSGDRTNPESYDHQEWITSVYYDGTTVHALVHDEYHDPFAPNCKPGDTTPANPCWWNSITYAFSNDGARTFQTPRGTTHVVAPPPVRWSPESVGDRGRPTPPPPHGYLEPSNIVDGRDGFYYTTFRSMPSRTDPSLSGTCVMRTADLADPTAWRYWNGSSYDGVFVDPYSLAVGIDAEPCARVSPSVIASLHGSLTWSTTFDRWLMLGGEVFPNDEGTLVCGFYASTSADLITWSPPKLIKQAPFGFDPCRLPGPVQMEAYPSFVDHADTSVNFERTGDSPHLYFMRSFGGLDRDLVRQRITFRR